MKSKNFAMLALVVCGSLAVAQAQKDLPSQPFNWKTTTDSWYTPKTYIFKLSEGDEVLPGMTVKGSVGYGPAGSDICHETTDPGACTADLISEKFREIELPGYSFPSGYSGVEYVTFDVQANGKINVFQVVKQPVVCKPCTQTAVNLVAAMGNWYPAIFEGRKVKSTVVVPVYFKTGNKPHNQ